MRNVLTLALVTALTLAASLLLTPTPALAHGCDVDGHFVDLDNIQPSNFPERVTFCHGTGSNTNPYVVITTDLSGACGHYKEHVLERPPRMQHPDVFPAFFTDNVATLCAGRL
jgi:hypothetical protein